MNEKTQLESGQEKITIKKAKKLLRYPQKNFGPKESKFINCPTCGNPKVSIKRIVYALTSTIFDWSLMWFQYNIIACQQMTYYINYILGFKL